MEKKAFEVSDTTINSIADFSSFALLERTYENRLSLDEAIKKVQDSQIEGLVGISIYQKQKQDDSVSYNYLSGFGFENEEPKIDTDLIDIFTNSLQNKLFHDSYRLKLQNRTIETYRFVKPILYRYQNRDILLGLTILYYDKEAVNAVVDRMTNLIFSVTINTLLIASLFVYFIGMRFTSPILQITKAATSVANGNLDIQLNIKTNDEIEELAEQFNKMVHGLHEKEKMQKFVSNSTMDMIQDGKKSALILGGEYRRLTFMFCDIRGFTALSESKEPSEVVSIINFYLDLQSQIIKANGGDIDKFIGDEVMASFSGKDSAQRAIKCSVEIQTMIAQENKKRLEKEETICELGIGINQGDVIVGNIGSHERMDFTSIGLAVNIAARLCSSANAFQICIEKTTYESSMLKYDVQTQEPMSIKGVSYPLKTYSIDMKGI